MLGAQATTRYKVNTVRTVSKERLLLMLFDGAIGFARAAKARLDAGDSVGFREYILKCQAIVSEFLSTLDLKVGGDVAVNLQQIYIFLLDHLNEANVQQRGKNAEDVARILCTLREGFDGAIRALATGAAARA